MLWCDLHLQQDREEGVTHPKRCSVLITFVPSGLFPPCIYPALLYTPQGFVPEGKPEAPGCRLLPLPSSGGPETHEGWQGQPVEQDP